MLAIAGWAIDQGVKHMFNRLLAAAVLVGAVPGMAIAGVSVTWQVSVPASGAGLTLGAAMVALYLLKKRRG